MANSHLIQALLVSKEVGEGGPWLATAREWMKSSVVGGDTLTWGSGKPVILPFFKLEDLAKRVAIDAILADRQAYLNVAIDALIHIQQVACSESPELAIATEALAKLEFK